MRLNCDLAFSIKTVRILVIQEVLFNHLARCFNRYPIHKSTRISRAWHLAESQARSIISVGPTPGEVEKVRSEF